MTVACDSSVLIPALASWHGAHEVARAAAADVTAVPAHVLTETYSVLTRLPAQRVGGDVAASALAALDWDVLVLEPAAHLRVLESAAQRGIVGGAVYDALVGATARAHGHRLLTRDRRARSTYDALGVECIVV